MKFIPWEKSTEIEDLQKFHIGIMPLSDNEWSKGKCGFKAIQYLALETPAVVSPVGVNSEIVKNGESGFQASSDEEWLKWLEKLITDRDLRNRMGKAGRIHVEQNYSVKSTEKRFLGMLN
jgi:glycosyltransferase involved in cell wall biosynthesis